jgi:hypothetical protein
MIKDGGERQLGGMDRGEGGNFLTGNFRLIRAAAATPFIHRDFGMNADHAYWKT